MLITEDENPVRYPSVDQEKRDTPRWTQVLLNRDFSRLVRDSAETTQPRERLDEKRGRLDSRAN
jgi:hypothetical protein